MNDVVKIVQNLSKIPMPRSAFHFVVECTNKESGEKGYLHVLSGLFLNGEPSIVTIFDEKGEAQKYVEAAKQEGFSEYYEYRVVPVKISIGLWPTENPRTGEVTYGKEYPL